MSNVLVAQRLEGFVHVIAAVEPTIHHFKISSRQDGWIRGSRHVKTAPGPVVGPRLARTRRRLLPAYDAQCEIWYGLLASEGISALFFVLSKTLGIMLLPANFLIGVGVAGLILLATRFASPGRKLVIASVALLAICGFSPLGNLLLYPLESRFPPWDAAQGAPDGIVVLGGAIEPDLSAAHGAAVFGSAASRVIAAAELAHRYPNARIIYSGGNANLLSDDAAKEADYAATVFESLGISRGRLMLERGSRNTQENAEFSKVLASPRSGERWLLVTSGFHMPRSIGIFRKAGFPVEPYPVGWRVGGRSDLFKFSIYAVEGLGRVEVAMREWMGLIAYRATGKTSELFPAPAQTR
jgi:uncharacterized SAM-binding protein YcdF (DUF218 family)